MEPNCSSRFDNPLSRREQFEDILFRLLKRESLDLYDLGVSFMFQIVAGQLLYGKPDRECHCFDGALALEGHVRKARQIEFTGEMCVMDYNNRPHRNWKEEFRATITDKRVTKQGIVVALRVGKDEAQAELADLLS